MNREVASWAKSVALTVALITVACSGSNDPDATSPDAAVPGEDASSGAGSRDAIADGRESAPSDVSKDASADRASSASEDATASSADVASGDSHGDGAGQPDRRYDGTNPDSALPDLIPDVGSTGRDGSSSETVVRADATDGSGSGVGQVRLVSDKVLSANATAIKSYDTNVNVASYRQHGLLFFGGYQFVAWFNGNARNAIVGRRTLDATTLEGGTWAWAYVSFRLSSDGDSHNVMSMGISQGDGRLHIAIGQHGAQLYSVRTVANAITGAMWDNTVFGGTGASDTGAASPTTGLPGFAAPTSEVTYPYFANATDGSQRLQLAYRTGGSGDGEMQLAEYDVSQGTWSHVGQITSAAGTYTQGGVASSTRNAYPHGFAYDERGRLHMAFTWRENLNVSFLACNGDTINNHDTLYIYSDDRGRTWSNNAGDKVVDVTTGMLAGVTSPGLVIDLLPVGRDLMNQETQVTDWDNLLHVVISYVPEPQQPGCATDRTQAQPFHLWRAADGTWTKTQLRLDGKDVNQGYDRSKVFVDRANNVYVLLPDLRLVAASAEKRWTDWRLLWDGRNLQSYGEAIIDVSLSRVAQGVSVLYMKDTSAATGELHVLDLAIR